MIKRHYMENQFLKIEAKTRITSGADTSRTKTKSITRTAEMRTLRSITGHTLHGKILNQEIRRISDIQDIVRLTRQRRREWNQHINRMEDNIIAKIARDGKLHSRRAPGRPPKRWRIAGCRRRKELFKARKTG